MKNAVYRFLINSTFLLLFAVVSILALQTKAEAQLTYRNTDFKFLFNNYRFSQAKELPWPGTYWPFEGGSQGSGINHIPRGEKLSPAQKYDLVFGGGGRAAKWEEDRHSCKNVDRDNKEACRNWYGHCNGWTGAALLNPEPDYEKTYVVKNPKSGEDVVFNYMDIKALLSEIWLDVYASFEGTGTSTKAGDWVFDPENPTAREVAANNSDLTNYEAYWDTTPRAFFLAITNYLGQQQVGLAIDRFTGSEIWNQPVIAYRILPIQGNTDKPISGGPTGRDKIFPITVGVKIYWANDSVDYDYKRTSSLNWNVTDAKFSNDNVPASFDDVERTDDGAVEARYLSMTLFFDGPVEVSADGTKILSAGKMIGDGTWTFADPEQRAKFFAGADPEDTQTHPDFIWRPDQIAPQASYRNPYIDPRKFYRYVLQRPIPGN